MHAAVLDAVEDITEELEAIQAATNRLRAQLEELRDRLLRLEGHVEQVDSSRESESNEGDQQVILIRRWPRGHQILPFHYFNPEDRIARVHFEYARVARRGANNFMLADEGQPLEGWLPVSSLRDGIILEARPFDREQGPSPLSSYDEAPVPRIVHLRQSP